MTASNWYYISGKERVGPIDKATFEGLVEKGTIQSATLIWTESMTEWQPYGDIFTTTPDPVPTPPANPIGEGQVACVECGSVFPKDEVITFRNQSVCAQCKPILMAKISQGATDRNHGLNYAGFLSRAGAKILDWIIVATPNYAVVYVIFGTLNPDVTQPDILVPYLIFNLVSSVVSILYTWLLTWKFGGTLGKLAVGLKVVTADGQGLSLWRALGRTFGEFLSALTLGIGYIIAAFDEEKRALHDHVCGTRVVHK